MISSSEPSISWNFLGSSSTLSMRTMRILSMLRTTRLVSPSGFDWACGQAKYSRPISLKNLEATFSASRSALPISCLSVSYILMRLWLTYLRKYLSSRLASSGICSPSAFSVRSMIDGCTGRMENKWLSADMSGISSV